MTIQSAQTVITTHVGNGIADTFDYEFVITAAADLRVVEIDLDGVETEYVLDTDYTVAGVNEPGGGSITLLAGALTSGFSLVIADNVAISQDTRFTNQSAFYGHIHEQAFDKMTRLIKRMFYRLGNSLQFSDTVDPGVSRVLPSPESLKLMRWNYTADALENVGAADIGTEYYFSNFIVDNFNDGVDFTAGVTTQLTLSADPAVKQNTWVYFDGTYLNKENYALAAGVLTFNDPIPGGTAEVEVVFGTAAPVPISVAEGIIGDPGSEGSGINIGGVTYDSVFKVSDIASGNLAQTILHRHSDAFPPLIVAARSKSTDNSHLPVTDGDDLFTLYAAGWTGTEYNIFASLTFEVDTGYTVSDSSAPGKMTVGITEDGNTFPTPMLELNSLGDALLLSGQMTAVSRRNEQAGDYSTVASDRDKVVVSTGASPQTFTLTNAQYAEGSVVNFHQKGAGALTLALDSGTLTPPPGGSLVLAGQGAMAGAYKIGATEWIVFGNTQVIIQNLLCPVGMVAPFPSTTPPTGWLECNGATLLRASYPDLWAFAQASSNLVAEGSKQEGNFGDGDGATTFTLPDYRGVFVRGWDNGAGRDSGRTIGSYQANAVETHQHYSMVSTDGAPVNPATTPVSNSNYPVTQSSTGGEFSAHIAGSSTPANVGLTSQIGGAAETRPKNVAVMYCIRT